MNEKNMLALMPKLSKILTEWAKFAVRRQGWETMEDASLALTGRTAVAKGLKAYIEENHDILKIVSAIRIVQLDDLLSAQHAEDLRNEAGDDDFDLSEYPS